MPRWSSISLFKNAFHRVLGADWRGNADSTVRPVREARRGGTFSWDKGVEASQSYGPFGGLPPKDLKKKSGLFSWGGKSVSRRGPSLGQHRKALLEIRAAASRAQEESLLKSAVT